MCKRKYSLEKLVWITWYTLRAQSRKRNRKAQYRCRLSLGGKFGKRNRGHRYRFIWVRLPILCLAVSFTWLRSKCIPSYSNQLFKRIFSFAYGYGLEKHINVFSKIPYNYNSWTLFVFEVRNSKRSSKLQYKWVRLKCWTKVHFFLDQSPTCFNRTRIHFLLHHWENIATAIKP